MRRVIWAIAHEAQHIAVLHSVVAKLVRDIAVASIDEELLDPGAGVIRKVYLRRGAFLESNLEQLEKAWRDLDVEQEVRHRRGVEDFQQ